MTGLVRKATLLTVCGLMLAGAAMAGVPSGANSTMRVFVADYHNKDLPNGIPGFSGATGQLTTTIRDALNNPVSGAQVKVEFSQIGPNGKQQAVAGCATDVNIGTPQLDPAATLACGTYSIEKTAGVVGDVLLVYVGDTEINIPGWPAGRPGASPVRNIGPAGGPICAAIYARVPAGSGSYSFMGNVQVRILKYDTDSDNDVDAGDGSYHGEAQANYFSPYFDYRMFYDYDNDGDVDSGDGSLHVDAQGVYGFRGISGNGTVYNVPAEVCP